MGILRKRRLINAAYFLGPLIIAAVVLFYKLGTLPPTLSLDEHRFAYFAANLNGSHYLPYFVGHDSFNDNHPTFMFYQILAGEKLIGPSIFAARFLPALYSFLTVAVFFFLIKELLGKKYACLGALILTLSYKFIALGRWLSETQIYLFTLTLSSLFLIKAAKDLQAKKFSSYRYIILMGLAVGLMFNTYAAAQVFLPVFPAVLIIMILKNRPPLKFFILALVLYSLSFLITASPMVVAYFKAPPGSFNSRKVDLPLFRTDVPLITKIKMFGRATEGTLKMFNIRGSAEPCYSYPGSKFLDPLSGLLLLIGLVFSFLKLNKWLATTIFGLFIVSMVPSFLSQIGAVPQEVRASGAIIFCVIYIVLALNSLGLLIKPPILRYTLLALVITVIAGLNLKSYFINQMQVNHLCQGSYDQAMVKEAIVSNLSSKQQNFLLYPVFNFTDELRLP